MFSREPSFDKEEIIIFVVTFNIFHCGFLLPAMVIYVYMLMNDFHYYVPAPALYRIYI